MADRKPTTKSTEIKQPTAHRPGRFNEPPSPPPAEIQVAKLSTLGFRPTADVRVYIDEMVEDGLALSAADAVNQLIRKAKASAHENRRAIAQACGGKDEVALGIAVARIAGAVSKECRRDFINDRDTFEQMRLAVSEFFELIEPDSADPGGLFEEPAKTTHAAELVIGDVKASLRNPDKNYWPFNGPHHIDEELDKTLLPLKELVKLYAHWADRKKD